MVDTAWEYDGSCLPFDRIEGNGFEVELGVKREWERDDRMALALGIFDSSDGVYEVENLGVRGAYDLKEKVTCDGVIIRGRATVNCLTVQGIAGMGKPAAGPTPHGTEEVREVFGFRITQNDIIQGFTYGGHMVSGLKVRGSEPYSYVSAVCVSSRQFTQYQDGKPVQTFLDWSKVSDVEVDLATGNHAALTALQKVHFMGGKVLGPKNGFYCDTGTLKDVIVEDYHMRLSRAAVALGTKDGLPKGDIVVPSGTFVFDGPGPFYAAELFDPQGLCGRITFDHCRFKVPSGTKFYLWSTQDSSEPDVHFDSCEIPKGALTNVGTGV